MEAKETKEAKSITKYVHYSPYKARAVVDLIRGKTIEQAINALNFSPKKGAKIVSKTLKSAIANAQFNHSMNLEALYVHTIFVDHGPTWGRFMPRAMGRASAIKKPTSHITVILKESEEILKQIQAAQIAQLEAKKSKGKKGKAADKEKDVKKPEEEEEKAQKEMQTEKKKKEEPKK